MADGAEFSIDFDVKGGDAATSAAASLAALAEKLTIAGTAALQASEAVKIGQAAYNQAETAANRAATAVEKIGIAADAQRGKLQAAMDAGDGSAAEKAAAKLQNLVARQAEAVSKSTAATAAMTAEAAALDKLKSAAAAAADNEGKLATQHSAAAKAAKEAEKGTKSAGDAAGGGSLNFRALSAGLGKLGGPLGSIGSQAAGVGGALQKLSKALGGAGPYVAAAVLAVALATAFVAAGLAITKFAVESADAARTSALLSDGIAGSVKGGRALDDAIDRIGKTVPQSREELLAMAGDLAKTGLKGEALSKALEETATKAAKLKWGPDFAKQLISLPNQAARLKQNISGIFSGLNIEGLLEGLSKLVALFDKNSATAEALKTVFESLFQPVVDGLTGLIPKAVSTFIQLEILGMKAAIAIKPYRGILIDIGIGFALLAAVVVGVIAIFVGAGLLMVAAFAALLALPFLIKDGFNYLADGIKSGIGAATDWLSEKFNAVVGFFQSLSLAEIGTQLINGLVEGLKAAGPNVLNAITGIASGAVDAAKKALGIKSPSTVFAEIGKHTAAGMEKGVDGGAAGVQSSVEDLVSPPDVKGGGVNAGPAKGSSGGTIVNVENLILQSSTDDPEGFAAQFRALIAGYEAQAGTAVP